MQVRFLQAGPTIMKYTFTIEEYTEHFKKKVIEYHGWYLRRPLIRENGTYSGGKVQFESIIDFCKFISSL